MEKYQFDIFSSPMECNEPIDVLSHKLGVYRCGPGGKESKTYFELMSTDGLTSIVKCMCCISVIFALVPLFLC
jgi:hypothetical protein